MDKLTRVILNRLRQEQRRKVKRIALTNGLLDLKISDWNGELIRCYTPAFDTSSLTMNLTDDLVWFRKRFAPYLRQSDEAEPHGIDTRAFVSSVSKRLSAGGDVKGDPAADASNTASFPHPAMLRASEHHSSLSALGARTTSGADGSAPRLKTCRAYAVRLVGETAPSPQVGHIITAIILARAVRDSRIPLRNLMDTLRSPVPLVAIQSMIRNVEDHILQLFGASLIAGGSKWEFVDATTGYNYDDYTHREGSETRCAVHYDIFRLSRDTPDDLRRRVAKMLARGMPILAVADTPDQVPDSLLMVADLTLTIPRIDRVLVETIVSAIYGDDGREALAAVPPDLPLRRLGMDDLLLAFRPGRSAGAAIRTLIALVAEHEGDVDSNEGDDVPDADPAKHDDGDSSDDSASFRRRMKALSEHEDRLSRSKGSRSTSSPEGTQDEKRKSSSRSNSRSGKSSGAEVVEPEDLDSADASAVATRGRPPLTVENLVGYGRARDWALGLKADLQDYIAGDLQWSDMSTKLLLSGPPGTGKTTFARALCNSLQVPLLVTSVSTWLEGGHLNDVIVKMRKTFEEARDRAPCILFIDEIDGIGQRQPSHREYADYWNTVVNKLLELLDGAVKSEGVIVVGATNLPHQIDPALRRSGRLETHIEIPKPDIDTLAGILTHHLGGDIKHLMSSVEPNRSAEQADRSATSDEVGESLGPDDQIVPDSDGSRKLQKRIGQ